ncbi:MAG: hypothetical protein LBV32_09460 [Tannerellaceae bacterium]|jgi:hypothetical protein|nr:hypothetical protein [Tannerellaceae bacterium]
MMFFGFAAALFWGILAGILVAGLAAFLINALTKMPVWQTGLAGIFLFIFLSFHFAAIIGGARAKSMLTDMEVLSATVGRATDWSDLVDEYTFLKPYLKEIAATAADEFITAQMQGTDMKTFLLTCISSAINRFMWRHAAWALGGIIVCFAGVVALDAAANGGGGRNRGQRPAVSSPRRSNGAHVRPRAHRRI